MDDPIIAGVELGGTKAVAVLARGRSIIDRFRLPTTTPTETLSRIADQLARWHVDRPFEALGVGSFGPVRLDPEAEDYGRILDTPKPDWSGADVIGALTRGHDRPCRIDTDVNAAVLAEKRWGAARDVASACYLTLGTGVGGGLLIDGAPVRGALHPEVGHLRMRRATGDASQAYAPFMETASRDWSPDRHFMPASGDRANTWTTMTPGGRSSSMTWRHSSPRYRSLPARAG